VTTSEMRPEIASAVRAELSAIGTKSSRLRRHQRRARLLAVGVGAIIVGGLTTGAAIVVSHYPGTTTVTPVGSPHSATGTGPGTLDLGRAPAGSTRVVLTVRCLNSTGSISIAGLPQNPGDTGDVATFYCTGGGRVDSHGVVRPWHMNDALPPKRGTTSIAITADPGTRWAITGRYASASTTPWGKNSRGQTYGACNANGCPDLQGAQATNGATGYIVSNDFDDFGLCSGYLPVYESDGTTVIGKFSIGMDDQGNPVSPGQVNGSAVPACVNPTHAR